MPLILYTITGTQWIEAAITLGIIVFISVLLYVFGVFSRKPRQQNERSAVVSYRPYPNQPRWQIGIRSRYFDYEGFDQSYEDNRLGITQGTLLYLDENEIVSYPRKLDMKDDLSFNGERAIKENRVYVDIVEDRNKTNLHLALEAARDTILSQSKKIEIQQDRIDELEEADDAKKLKKEMKKGSVLTGRTISSHGISPKSTAEKIKEAQAQKKQKPEDEDDEDEEEEEEESEDDYE